MVRRVGPHQLGRLAELRGGHRGDAVPREANLAKGRDDGAERDEEDRKDERERGRLQARHIHECHHKDGRARLEHLEKRDGERDVR
eukprot:scaffold68563_cov31-Tisochrysis_lutea.AAC.6